MIKGQPAWSSLKLYKIKWRLTFMLVIKASTQCSGEPDKLYTGPALKETSITKGLHVLLAILMHHHSHQNLWC